MKYFFISLLVILALNFENSGRAEMQVPEVSLDDILFQPQIRSAEMGVSDAKLYWDLGAKAHFGPWVDVNAIVGSSNLLDLPRWSTFYAPPSAMSGLALIELKGVFHTSFGDFYAGQTMVPWGLEGRTPTALTWFPRTLLVENGAIALRDVGLGFHTDFNIYEFNILVHAGEGGTVLTDSANSLSAPPNSATSDNRYFLTAQWSVHGPLHSVGGLSATDGRIAYPNALLTVNGPTNTIVPGQSLISTSQTEFRVRGANGFYGFNIFGLGLQAEISYLQYFNDNLNINTLAWHLDGEQPLNDHINLVARYETYNPNTNANSIILNRIYAGVEVHSEDNHSRLFIYGIKNSESQYSVPNDAIMAIWRVSTLTP